jgi:iron complex outermembrane recepter protein
MRRTLPIFLCASLTAHAQSPASTADAASAPVNLENVVISAAPLERDQTHLAMATTVLSGSALTERIQPTLGETLATLPGISSTYFGPGASRPVIRGLGEDRIRVLANGLGTIDASVISPDHAVSIDPLLIERVEVVRGPAALLYGGNAIGGVVNVIDHRIHHRSLDEPFSSEIESRYSSVDDGWSNAAFVEGSSGVLSWHVDGYRRTTQDLSIPGYAHASAVRAREAEATAAMGEPYEPAQGTLPNSSTETDGAAAGLSLSGSRGFVGLSFSGHNSVYGVPPGDVSEGEENTRLDLRQRRVDLQAELSDPLPGFEKAKLKLGMARYRHQELDDGVVGTTFKNRGYEGRVELVQTPINHLDGAVGFQTSRSRFGVQGDEAFLPESVTQNYGLFAFEEYKTTPLTYQLGARLDRQELGLRDGSGLDRNDNAMSVSAGAIWAIDDAWSLSGTLARNERAPNVQELYADGPHAGTQTFEIGNPDLNRERSLAAELVLRRRAGRVTGEVALFAHRFSGYVFQSSTGEVNAEDGLPIVRYDQQDVNFYGAEFEALVHLHESAAHTLDLRLTTDFVRAKERDSDLSLPRITPRRASVGLDYRSSGFSAGVTLLGVERAKHLAPEETPTPGYVWLNAQMGYAFTRWNTHFTVFARGDNLTNETARNHVSFLKDLAPLPGRNVTLGLQVAF